jgi:hypothetical protein
MLKNTGSPWEVEVREASPTMTSTAAIASAAAATSASGRPNVRGEGVRHFAAGKIAAFDIDLHGKAAQEEVNVSITSPSKRQLSSRLLDVHDAAGNKVCRAEFNPSEVGSYIIDVTIAGEKIQGSPFVAKAYDSSLIRVSDVTNGSVGQPCQFRGQSLLILLSNATHTLHVSRPQLRTWSQPRNPSFSNQLLGILLQEFT